jgi:hypothetical protein
MILIPPCDEALRLPLQTTEEVEAARKQGLPAGRPVCSGPLFSTCLLKLYHANSNLK